MINGLTEYISTIFRMANRHYGKAFKGWRCRKADDYDYPLYEDKRKKGHENVACKGRSWKLVDSKRVWFDK